VAKAERGENIGTCLRFSPVFQRVRRGERIGMFRISAERNEIRYQDDKEIYGLVLFLIRSKEEASDPDVIFDLHSTEIGLELAKIF
jgi:hypothetical protein